MQLILQIIIPILFFTIPIFLFRRYLNSLELNSKRMVNLNMTASSELFTDLKVWTKNFDFLKSKKKFETNIYNTNYSFNDCDLILNNENFIVIGKSNFFGRNRALTPTVFEYSDKKMKLQSRHVVCQNIKEVGHDLEIEFIDNQYKNNMIFVIKRIDTELKSKIIKGYNKS